MKQGVLRNFTKFTGKHLRQSLFLNKVAVQLVLGSTAYKWIGTCGFALVVCDV